VSDGFRVGVTRDVRREDGSRWYDFDLLEEAGIGWEFLPEHSRELPPEVVAPYDAVMVFSPRVTAATVEGQKRLSLIARLGVGYDSVDVDACTANGVLLTISPDGIRRPMACSGIALILALAHRLFQKDRHVRAAGWERFQNVGVGLRNRTLGIVGLGTVGRELSVLARPFELRIVAADPYATPVEGVELIGLDELLREADFVCLTCPLTAETRHLINAERLALMKPTAFLINIARGPIVDQAALTRVLQERRIAGAALDVFEREPIEPDDPLLALDNVILTPHAVCLTDELFALTGRNACENVLAVAQGRVPRDVVNREALEHPRLKTRLS
jgi:phosphoglycerate dehydrogenase-like enzyme